MGKHETTEFIILAEAGILETQALLLCESIRRFGGQYAEAPIAVISPRPDRRPSSDTLLGLEELGVRYVPMDIVSPVPDYGPSFRVLASAAYEQMSTADILVALDSDTVFLGEPCLDLSDAHAAARPVDVQGMCTTGKKDPRDAYWRQLCDVCAVDYGMLPLVTSTVDKRLIKASYNAGFIVARKNQGIFHLAADYFLRSVKAGLRPFADRGIQVKAGHGLVSRAGSEYWGSSQACLSLALWGSGFSVWTLPLTHNFPLHFYEHLQSEIESGRLSNIIHVHYHHLFSSPSSPNVILDGCPGFPQEGVTWLREQLRELVV